MMKEVKTFVAIKKSSKLKVFQFTKDMLPEINKEILEKEIYYVIYKFINNIKIGFVVWRNGDILMGLHSFKGDEEFKVGDYIVNDNGYCHPVSKNRFEKKYEVLK